MTDKLREIRERAEKATAGPWTTTKPLIGAHGFADGMIVAAVAPRQGIWAMPSGGTYPEADRQFIAHAREDIPYLLSERDALAQRVSELTGAMQAREVLGGALGLNMDETVVEACRRTSKSFKAERDALAAQLAACVEAMEDVQRVLILLGQAAKVVEAAEEWDRISFSEHTGLAGCKLHEAIATLKACGK